MLRILSTYGTIDDKLVFSQRQMKNKGDDLNEDTLDAYNTSMEQITTRCSHLFSAGQLNRKPSSTLRRKFSSEELRSKIARYR